MAAFTKGGAKPRRFGRYQKDDRDRGKWREYRDKTKLRGDVDAHTVFDVAEVWSRPDRATAVSMTFGSDSGDWVEFADYCFRPDGGLARMLSTLNTFNAVTDDGPDVQGVHRERLRHFAVGGGQLRVASTVVELTTRKPIPGVQFMDRDDEVHISKGRSTHTGGKRNHEDSVS